MPRDLFGNVTRPSISIGSKKWYTLPVSMISHAAIVLALIAIPILAPAVMPTALADYNDVFVADPVPPPPPPIPKKTADLKPIQNPDAAPIAAPDTIAPERPSVPSGWEDETRIGTINVDTDPSVIAPPPAPEKKVPPQAVRPGFQGVRTPVKTLNVDPVYPPIAQQAHIQGIVIIEATIGVDGQVTNARILRSVPLLDQAALEAVRQWEFTPTTLNGQPVPVIMTVTVNFTLQ